MFQSQPVYLRSEITKRCFEVIKPLKLLSLLSAAFDVVSLRRCQVIFNQSTRSFEASWKPQDVNKPVSRDVIV